MKAILALISTSLLAGAFALADSDASLAAKSPATPAAPPRSNPTEPAGVSAPDWSSIHTAHDAACHTVQREEDSTLTAHNSGQQWRTRFDGRGFTVTPKSGGWTWGLELRRYGFTGAERTVGEKAAVSHAQGRVHYDWDATLREWFVNDTRGLEQGWTFYQRPAGAEEGGPLRVELAVRGGLQVDVSADGASMSYGHGSGATELTYSGLKAWDADGRTLPVRFEPTAEGESFIRVAVEEAGARYPVTIDPIAQGPVLFPSDGKFFENFGDAVAISGDTLVIGAAGEDSSASGINDTKTNTGANNSGAAYVFVRNGNTWTQQAYLKASNTGGGDNFGYSVAISGDTLIVGAYREDSAAAGIGGDQNDNSLNDAGAAYIFVRIGTTWTQQAYLKPASPTANARFGFAVGISGDRVVATADRENAAYVFVRNGTNWAQEDRFQRSESGIESSFGYCTAISGDTILVGVPGKRGTGAAYVFVHDGTMWTEQARLVGTAVVGTGFGFSVALDGDTALIGAVEEDPGGINFRGEGAAFVFVREGTTWTKQVRLKASNADFHDSFGWAVGLSRDVAIITSLGEDSSARGIDGNQSDNSDSSGAAYMFVRNGTTWTQGAYLKGRGDERGIFGWAAGVSGSTIIVGENSGYIPGTFDAPGVAEIFELPEIDSDDDGLPDSWETQGKGIDVNGDGVIDLDLYSKGARPDHKDLFVEVDTTLTSLDANLYESFDAVVSAFANAPVPNPDNVTGIKLHLDEDGDADVSIPEETTPIPVAEPRWPAHFASTKASYFGSQTQRSHANHVHILEAKALAYRYCIIYAFLDFSQGGNGYVGRGEIGGNDFITQVDDTAFYDEKHDVLDLAGVLMHELGHTLNLRHGGSDDINGKPNYPSVMNYVNSVPMDHSVTYWRLDYSREPLTGGGGLMLPSLNENALNEATGIPSTLYQNYWMPYGIEGPGGRRLLRMAPLNGNPVNYKEDGVITPGNVTVADLNYIGSVPGIPGMASVSPGQPLPAYNDWANLQYRVNPDNTESGAVEFSEGCPTSESIAFLENNVPVVAATFEAWIAMYGGVGALTGPDQDADGDGVVNFLERYLGTQPTKWSAGLEATVGGGGTGFRHTRGISSGIDVAASYEWSTDLANWHASGSTAEGLTVTMIPVKVDANPSNDIVEIIPVITGNTSKLFYRLRVTTITP